MYKIQLEPNPDMRPRVDKKLYAIMQDIYTKYTGYQVAAVVAEIRREIELERESLKIDEEVAELVARKNQLLEDENPA